MAAEAGSGRLARGLAILADTVAAWRSGLVADPRFRRLAARFPLTRAVARAETAALFGLAAGFVHSQILAAFVRLGLVPFLNERPRSAFEVAALAGLAPARAERLLRAAAALRLARQRSDGRWGLGDLGAALVGNDGVTAMVEHHAILYGDLADPVALLRSDGETGLSRFWGYAARDPDAAAPPEAYSRLMSASQAFFAEEVLNALPLAGHRRLMDLGGGSGAFVEAAAKRAPGLSFILVDLPEVCDIARARLGRAGLGERVAVHGADMLREALPEGADIVTLNRVLHDHDDEAAFAILGAARAALPRGGTIAVAEPMAGAAGAGRAVDAYFGFYLLAMRQGRPRSFAEIAALVRRAGFSHVRPRRTATPLIASVLTARA